MSEKNSQSGGNYRTYIDKIASEEKRKSNRKREVWDVTHMQCGLGRHPDWGRFRRVRIK